MLFLPVERFCDNQEESRNAFGPKSTTPRMMLQCDDTKCKSLLFSTFERTFHFHRGGARMYAGEHCHYCSMHNKLLVCVEPHQEGKVQSLMRLHAHVLNAPLLAKTLLWLFSQLEEV